MVTAIFQKRRISNLFNELYNNGSILRSPKIKNIERQEAFRLRKENGLSLGDISKRLNVSKSTVSGWVRHIELSQEQKDHLIMQNSRFNGSLQRKEKGLQHRLACQKLGKELFEKSIGEFRDLLIAGVMLYWGEGTKSRYTISFCNSELHMMKFFLKFLKICLGVKNEEVSVYKQCYTDINPVEEIEKYWINNLDLKKENLRKTIINKYSNYSLKKNCGKSAWGTCTISIHNVEKIQMIYGVIQTMGQFCNENWGK